MPKKKKLTNKEIQAIKEDYMDNLDAGILNLLIKLGKKTKIPTEGLGEETFCVLMSFACRLAVDIGIDMENVLKIAADYHQAALEQIENEEPETFENELINYKISPDKLN